MTALQACLAGDGPLADRLAAVLDQDGWATQRLTLSASATPTAGATLLVIAPSDGAGQDWHAVLDRIVVQPVRLIQALAARQPDPAMDASGEQRAPAQVIVMLDKAALVPGCAPPARIAAMAALRAATKDAALALAPGLRVNAIAIGSDGTDDPAPSMRWLIRAHAVTGQIIEPGAPVRPATPWRKDATLSHD